uniref:protein MGARP-like n=1 Tax=Pristiophorus japonicus TaxID=55135 RepID=UPI00398F3D6E
MYFCRAAWRDLVPLARISSSSRLIGNVYRNASIRQMSSGGLPGSSSENTLYALMIGAVFVGGSLYTYKVLHTDKARYNDRVAEIMERPKSESMAKESRPKKEDESDDVQSPEVVEASGEASEPVTEEAEVPAAESVEQPESPSTVAEPNESPLEEKAATEEEVIEVLLLPASAKESDDVQSPEVVEASGEASEPVTEEAEVPAAESVEQPESPSTVAEPNESPLEETTETSAAAQKE